MQLNVGVILDSKRNSAPTTSKRDDIAASKPSAEHEERRSLAAERTAAATTDIAKTLSDYLENWNYVVSFIVPFPSPARVVVDTPAAPRAATSGRLRP